MIKEVCQGCLKKRLGWSAADEERWDKHSLVVCPALAMPPGTTDNRLSRNVEGTDDVPEWCPEKMKHVRVDPRKKKRVDDMGFDNHNNRAERLAEDGRKHAPKAKRK